VIVDQDNRRNQATPNGLSSPLSWGRFRSGCANEKPGSEAGLIANIPSQKQWPVKRAPADLSVHL
jgi:hypothetical protein